MESVQVILPDSNDRTNDRTIIVLPRDIISAQTASTLYPGDKVQYRNIETHHVIQGVSGRVLKVMSGVKGMILYRGFKRLQETGKIINVTTFGIFMNDLIGAFEAAGYFTPEDMTSDLGLLYMTADGTLTGHEKGREILMMNQVYYPSILSENNLHRDTSLNQRNPFYESGDYPLFTVKLRGEGHKSAEYLLDWDGIIAKVIASIGAIGYEATLQLIRDNPKPTS